jgi:hypothetical protein
MAATNRPEGMDIFKSTNKGILLEKFDLVMLDHSLAGMEITRFPVGFQALYGGAIALQGSTLAAVVKNYGYQVNIMETNDGTYLRAYDTEPLNSVYCVGWFEHTGHVVAGGFNNKMYIFDWNDESTSEAYLEIEMASYPDSCVGGTSEPVIYVGAGTALFSAINYESEEVVFQDARYFGNGNQLESVATGQNDQYFAYAGDIDNVEVFRLAPVCDAEKTVLSEDNKCLGCFLEEEFRVNGVDKCSGAEGLSSFYNWTLRETNSPILVNSTHFVFNLTFKVEEYNLDPEYLQNINLVDQLNLESDTCLKSSQITFSNFENDSANFHFYYPLQKDSNQSKEFELRAKMINFTILDDPDKKAFFIKKEAIVEIIVPVVNQEVFEEVENSENHEETPLIDFLKKNQTKSTFKAIMYLAIASMIAGGCSLSCFNLGFGFLKTFQIVEVLEILRYTPVIFQGKLKICLELISETKELAEFDNQTIVKGHESGLERSWGKLTELKTFKNIFQSFAFAPLLITCSSFLILMVQGLKIVFYGKKKKVNWISKVVQILTYLTLLLQESNFLEICFFATYNQVSYKRKMDSSMFISQIFSSLFNSWLYYFYLNLSYKAWVYDTTKMSLFEKELITQGFKETELKISRFIRVMNPVFRLRLMVLCSIVVLFQPLPSVCLILMLTVQSSFLLAVAWKVYSRGGKNIFTSVFSFLSFISIEIYIWIFVKVCFKLPKIGDPHSVAELEAEKVVQSQLAIGSATCLGFEVLSATISGISGIIGTCCRRKKPTKKNRKSSGDKLFVKSNQENSDKEKNIPVKFHRLSKRREEPKKIQPNSLKEKPVHNSKKQFLPKKSFKKSNWKPGTIKKMSSMRRAKKIERMRMVERLRSFAKMKLKKGYTNFKFK